MAEKQLKLTESQRLSDFVHSHLFIQMRYESKIRPGEYAEIVGWRTIGGDLLYTVRFDDGLSIDIPSEKEQMSEICIGSPRTLYV